MLRGSINKLNISQSVLLCVVTILLFISSVAFAAPSRRIAFLSPEPFTPAYEDPNNKIAFFLVEELKAVIDPTNLTSAITVEDTGVNLIEDVLEEETLEFIKAELFGKPLFYPNPMSLNEGGTLGYQLSKPMEIEIRLYDMRLFEVYRETFSASFNGGLGGTAPEDYNKVNFDSTSFQGSISAGVHVFVLIHEGKVLKKGKVMILP
jgi:hypothetical protein